MSTRPVSDARLERTITAVLGERVLTPAALAGELERHGVHIGVDGTARVQHALEGIGAFPLGDDDWLLLDHRIDGLTWTVAVTAADLEKGQLPSEPDLSLVDWVAMSVPLDTPDVEAAVRSVWSPVAGFMDRQVLAGPDGWLSHVDASCTELAVRLEGRQVVAAPTEGIAPLPSDPVAEAIRQAYASQRMQLADEVPVEDARVTVEVASVAPVIAAALVRSREVFSGGRIPLLDHVFQIAGLHRDGDELAPVDQPWELVGRSRRRAGIQFGRAPMSETQLDGSEAALLALEAFDEGADPPGETARLLAAALADPVVAGAVMGALLSDETDWEIVALFADYVLAHVDDVRDRVGPLALLGRARDLEGNPQKAEEAFAAIVAIDGDHRGALHGLATFKADRGDAVGAMGLLVRAGVTADDTDAMGELADEVAGWAAHRPRPTAGRNDACPCGSGRKYKTCHAGREQHPLIDRGEWLYGKAMRFLRDHDHRREVIGVAEAIARASDHAFSILDLLELPLTFDLVLHEGEVLREFLEQRSDLLPADEALTAAQWELTERALWEVEAVGRDSLELRDVRTGDRIWVSNVTPDATTHPGRLFLGRPLPIGGTHRAYTGLVPVSLAKRDVVLAALDEGVLDAVEMARVIGDCFRPPTLTNTDGDLLEFHELTFELPDVEESLRALASAVEAGRLNDHGGGNLAVARTTEDGRELVTASLSVDSGRLLVTTNSAARADTAIELVAELLPGASLVDHDVRTLAEVDRDRTDDDRRDVLDADDPEIAELLERVTRQHEERWLDENVPALGGRTPREAAEDPIGREQLEQLFAQFEHLPERPGTMSARRLRRALGPDEA